MVHGKKKITRRINGRQKKGVTGNVVKYISTTKAIRRLQITANDFRRLCILKGIFPRPAPKTIKAKNKTYYHLKDIQYMQHEPLLQKYRDLKIYLRKKTRLTARKETGLAESLEKPNLRIDHLVKERYPALLDAIRDLDDALTMLYLFNVLRVRIHSSFIDTRSNMVSRLCKEWTRVIQESRALRKVFVSIKGYYYQADIKGVPVTWLVPHKAVQNTPDDVDYSILSTFLEFYEALIRCVNFKLFKEEKIDYPPVFTDDDEKNHVLSFFEKKKEVVVKKSSGVTLPASVNAKARALDKDMEDTEEQDNSTDLADFHALDAGSLNLIDENQIQSGKLFADQVFLIGREVPFESVSFVIRSGGGIAFQEDMLSPEHTKSSKITFHIVDRPSLPSMIPSRKYVQPQWVFDSFNERVLLPIASYGIGEKLPPHLSPFVDDVKEGYVPEQRNVLRQWAGLEPLNQKTLDKIEKSTEQIAMEEEEKDEEEYKKGLLAESKKKTAKSTKPAKKEKVVEETIDIEDGEEFGEEDDEEEEDIEIDEDDDEDDEDIDISSDEEEVVKKPAPAPRPSTFNPKDNERELSKIVMKKKDKRLLTRMEFGIKRKAVKGEILSAKKRQAEGDVEVEVPRAIKSRRVR